MPDQERVCCSCGRSVDRGALIAAGEVGLVFLCADCAPTLPTDAEIVDGSLLTEDPVFSDLDEEDD
jgi:hypothetical protein